MAEDHHIDMSGRIWEKKTIGIACVSAQTKIHNGCALRGNLIKLIEKMLCTGHIREEYAKLYAICIFLLIKNKIQDINSLIICNDEDFNYVREYLLFLLESPNPPKIENITDFKKKLGRNIKSLADNFAINYRKRALNRNKWDIGRKLNVVEVDYASIKECWEKLNKIK